MHIAEKQLGPVQNMGWFDRVIRTLIGAALIFAVLLEMQKGVPIGGYAFLPIIAIYPLLTGILGWDPLYAAGKMKSCDTSPGSRNKCGTFFFEVESTLKKDMRCNNGYDCSISGNRKEHEKE